jgi:hypothetical protein
MKKVIILLLFVFSLVNSQEKNFFSLDIFAFVGLNYELNAKVGYVW